MEALELSKIHASSAGLALESQQTARAKVTARAAADLLRPGTRNSAEIHTHDLYLAVAAYDEILSGT